MRNLIPHVIQEHYLKEEFEGNVEALTIFVDVSGFTPMTQSLMKHGDEGAEALAVILNDVFGRMVNAVYKHGGFITLFAGDAFTAVFPFKEDGLSDETRAVHVVQCAGRMQSIFHRHGIQTTPFGQFTLRVKVGVSRGNVHWGIVGDDLKGFFYRGEAIDGCAQAEHHAEKGDIILDQPLVDMLHQDTLDLEPVDTGYYRLQHLKKAAPQSSLPNMPRLPRLKKQVLATFLPDAVIAFKRIGEFRTVMAVFISFSGIATKAELDEFTSLVLSQIVRYGGYFKETDFGDKGGVMVCFFGAPVAHEYDVDRALTFMLAVTQMIQTRDSLAGLRIRAGITRGRAYTGIIGGAKRCQYAVLGAIVNLAARLMMKAEWGDIFVSQEVRDKTVQFTFAEKGTLQYKGIAHPVPTYTLLSRKSGIRHQPFTGTMIGRQEELQQLQDFAAPIFQHRFAGIVYIYGEAGIGKSRLTYALWEALSDHHDLTWLNCPANQILRKPFNPFISCLMRYFDQSSEHTEAENRARFEGKYRELIETLTPHPGPLPRGEGEEPLPGPPPQGEGVDSPLIVGEGPGVRSELMRTKSIIGAQLGLFWPDSLWEHLNAKGKYDNTLAALKHFFLAHSVLKPLVIELEDGHWFDSDSRTFLDALTRNVAQYPILLLSTLRCNDNGTKTTFQIDRGAILEIDLNYFSATDIRHCAEVELNDAISDDLHTLLLQKTNGNPFFVQQLTRYFVENDVVSLQDGTWRLTSAVLKLPDTINAILIARIDRLADELKAVVKTAAVIGREFDLILLSAILKQDLRVQVQIAREAQIWEEIQEWVYLFTHALLRDAAYQMQLKSRLRELHQLTAETMEVLYATRSEKHYADLAFHYENAGVTDKTIEYLRKAADEAKAQYHNHQALELYERLLKHLKGSENLSGLEIDTLLKKAGMLRLTGHWNACQEVCEDALGLTEQRGDTHRQGWAELTLGIFFRDVGEYDNAMASFGRARASFERVNERAGIGRVLKAMGMVHADRGDYDLAMPCYKQAFTMCEELGDSLGIAKNARNMGRVYMDKSDYEAAMTWYHKSLQLCEALGEKLEKARVLNNMGNCYRQQGDGEAAIAYYNQAFKIGEELGDSHGIGIIANNMGILCTELKGDYDAAMTWYHKSLQIGEELGDKLNRAKVLNNIGECCRLKGDYGIAMAWYHKSQQISEKLGDKPGLAITLGNIGHIYRAQCDYKRALEPYDRALAIFRKLENKYCLCEYAIGKAEALFSLQRYEEAQELNTEGSRMAEEVGDKEYMFKGKVLSVRIAFALGDEDVPRRLEEMLQQTQDEAEIAALHYELWQMTHHEPHRQTALKIYQRLYETTPNIEYKTRMDEMQDSSHVS